MLWEHRHLPDLTKGLGWNTMAPIDADDYDQLLLLSYSAGSKTPKVERLSQQELFKRACNVLTLDQGAASAGLQLEMAALNKAVGLLGGTSRNICGLHYPSEVEAGQRLGEAGAQQILTSPRWQRFKQNPAVQQEMDKIRQVPASRLPQNDG